MDHEIARLNFRGKLQTVVEEKGRTTQSFKVDPWEIAVSYGLPQFGAGDNPPGNLEPIGRARVARLGEDQFLVTGLFCCVTFYRANVASGKQRQFMRVEEGAYENGSFKSMRIWNGAFGMAIKRIRDSLYFPFPQVLRLPTIRFGFPPCA